MIVTSAHEFGEVRLYMTRFNSVTAYFTDDGEEGTALHIEPGFFADPAAYLRTYDDVRSAVLAEAALRLQVPVDEVLIQPFSKLKRIATPDLPDHYRYARRSRNRAGPARV